MTAPEPREDVAVAEVGLTDVEWTRLRHAAGNRGDLGPIAEEFERILGERQRAAAVEALREAADLVNAERTAHIIASTRAPAAGALFRAEQAILRRADRRAER